MSDLEFYKLIDDYLIQHPEHHAVIATFGREDVDDFVFNICLNCNGNTN